MSAMLCGKGIWLLDSTDVDLALEMAGEIGATHLLCRTGYRAMFFPEVAGRLCARARATGLVPLAWYSVSCEHPEDEARVAIKTAEVGYAGIVFVLEERAGGYSRSRVEALGQRLLDARLNPNTLYYAGPPNPAVRPDLPWAEMGAFCRGGFMPRCDPSLRKPAEVVIHKMAYEEYPRWAKAEGCTVAVYPVLVSYRGSERLMEAEFARWMAALSEHKPTFFSVFHAAATDRTLWPILTRLKASQLFQVAEPLVLPGGVAAAEDARGAIYVVVGPDDTVSRLCRLHGCTWAQFWEWNRHLWDAQGLAHDPDYMQVGWRVRVK